MDLFLDLFEKNEDGSNGKFIETVNLKSIINAIVEFVKSILSNEFDVAL